MGTAFLELAKRDFDEVFGPGVPKKQRDEYYFLLKAFFLTYEDVTLEDDEAPEADDGDGMLIQPKDYTRPFFDVDEEEEEEDDLVA